MKIESVKQACVGKDVLFGMHPDGAVNYIIECACAMNINFCIVPCCVFPSVYKRTLNSGKDVNTREELLEWIPEQAMRLGWKGTFQRFKLGF